MKYKLNEQWVDLSIKALDSMEIGCIIQFMGNTIPNGWLECDGASISQSDYPDLYALIGGTLPNFKGRVLVGQDTSDTDFDTLGETGGEKKHTLTINEMPSHTHNTENICSYSNGIPNTNTGFGYNEISLNKSSYGKDVGATGGGQAHNNLQPYAVVKHIIKALNTTPTMASIVNGYSTSTQDGYSCDYINDLNDWKLVNTVSSNAKIVIPNNAKEIFLITEESGEQQYTKYIPTKVLKNNNYLYNGYYLSSQNNACCAWLNTSTGIQCLVIIRSGEERTGSSTTSLYYR